MSEWTTLISTVGFPIVVALFLLFRLERALQRMDKSINLLSVVVARASGLDFAALKAQFQPTNGGE